MAKKTLNNEAIIAIADHLLDTGHLLAWLAKKHGPAGVDEAIKAIRDFLSECSQR